MVTPVEVAAMLQLHPVVQQNYFDFIVRYFELNRCGPNPEEVREGVSVLFDRPVSKNAVYHHLKELSRHGKIELVQNRHKAVKIIVRESRWQYIGVNHLTGWKGRRRAKKYIHRINYDEKTRIVIDIPNYVPKEQWLEYCLKKIM